MTDEMKLKLAEGVPANACMLVDGGIEMGDNGPGAKTAPIRMLARSSKPIEHWFWGKVVHDLAGMSVHKKRLPVDYVHGEDAIGYLTHFDVSAEGLVCSGALTPWRDDDKASEIIAKMRMGVPYEASINFGGDGIEIEEVPENETVFVNGYYFAGPGVVIRKWPLRGVAVCPYGADANTESIEMSARKFAVNRLADKVKIETVQKQNNDQEIGDQTMTKKDEKPVEPVTELKAEAVQAVEAVESDRPAVAVEGAESAELEQSEPAAAEAVPEVATEEAKQFSVAEFAQMVEEFGLELATEVALNGGDYESAKELHYQQLKAQAAKPAQAMPEAGETEPAQFAATDDNADAQSKEVANYERKGLTPAQAKFAASCKMKKPAKK
jgi:hypothetical protein